MISAGIVFADPQADLESRAILAADRLPGDAAVVDPFVVVHNAPKLITFMREVFGGSENEGARTPTRDSKLMHSDIDLGGVTTVIDDRLDGWAARPGLLQIWVDDAQATPEAEVSRGASLVPR